MLKAVLFDIGGPIDMEERTEAQSDADIVLALTRMGFEVTEEAYRAAERRALASFAPNLYRSIVWQLTGRDLEKSRRISRWVEQQYAARVEVRGAASYFEPRPAMEELLHDLKRWRVKLALAANQPQGILAQLNDHGLLSYFDSQTVSAVHGFRKPDPRHFLYVCGQLDVTPVECVMVGDRIDNDLVPAATLGMRTVRFKTGRYALQRARSWSELPEFEVEDVSGLSTVLTGLFDSGL